MHVILNTDSFTALNNHSADILAACSPPPTEVTNISTCSLFFVAGCAEGGRTGNSPPSCTARRRSSAKRQTVPKTRHLRRNEHGAIVCGTDAHRLCAAFRQQKFHLIPAPPAVPCAVEPSDLACFLYPTPRQQRRTKWNHSGRGRGRVLGLGPH